jgi:ParB-like chromosome segregation protein Spo0J
MTSQQTSKYPSHPLSQILPMMAEKDLQELANDIERNGLRAPVTLLDGQILDGRNREKACFMVGVAPAIKTSTAAAIRLISSSLRTSIAGI